MKYLRCSGCGNVIANKRNAASGECEDIVEDVVKIDFGRLHNNKDIENESDRFESNEIWGYMHKKCFLLVVGLPVL
jgi:uncharacterized protein YgfB (UPF0149 family)